VLTTRIGRLDRATKTMAAATSRANRINVVKEATMGGLVGKLANAVVDWAIEQQDKTKRDRNNI
jgi:hypothetical protein